MKRYSIGQFAKKINKTQQTLRNWDKNGKLKPEIVDSDTGYRYYTDNQLRDFYGEISNDRLVIGYCWVSSVKQKKSLKRQVDDVRAYLISRGYQFKIITDIGSGMNYNNKGLNELIEMLLQDEVSKIVILYKDRLVRFGFELIQNICEFRSVEIEVIDNTIQSDEEEVVEDLKEIITVFSCRLQGKGAKKTKDMITELTKYD